MNENIIEELKLRNETIVELAEKVKTMTGEILELEDRLMVKTTFYDIFKDEMKDRYGYDSDEEAEQNYQEMLERDRVEKVNYLKCEKCEYIGKTENGVRIHYAKKHREKQQGPASDGSSFIMCNHIQYICNRL